MITENEAFRLIEKSSKRDHALMVSRMMENLARRLGEKTEEWKIVGLLHDLDYDETRNDRSQHGAIAAEKLKETLPRQCVQAIKAHDYRTGITVRSKLGIALIATDSLANLIESIGKNAAELNVETLQKALQDTSLKKPWLMSNLRRCKEIGVGLDDFLQLCLDSMK